MKSNFHIVVKIASNGVVRPAEKKQYRKYEQHTITTDLPVWAGCFSSLPTTSDGVRRTHGGNVWGSNRRIVRVRLW